MFDKIKIGLANFVFGIRSTSSIGIVNLDISLEMIVFYIIQVNILFLLYLANIDKLKAFFNNLTNEII